MRWDIFALELLKPLGQAMMAGALIYGGILLGKAIMVVEIAKAAIQESDAKTKLAEAKLKEMGETDVMTNKDDVDNKCLQEVIERYNISMDKGEKKDVQ